MKLAKLLDIDHILLDMKASEHWPAILELVDFLSENGDIPGDCREGILTALQEREEQVSTGIGSVTSHLPCLRAVPRARCAMHCRCLIRRLLMVPES